MRRADLRGLLVGPAFGDAHAHPPIGALYLVQADLHDVVGRAAYGDAIVRWADANPEAPWIVGAGWADGAIADQRLDATWLASLGVGRPIFLRSRAWHSALVDPIALGLAGITDVTPDPSDGRIDRDARHLPTGVLHEAAVDLVTSLIPEVGHTEWVEAILRAQALFHGVGIAAWQDAAVYPATLAAYRDLDASGRLTMRTSAALLWDRHRGVEQLDELDDARRATPGQSLHVDTVKIMLDGIVESETAAWSGRTRRPLEQTGRAATSSSSHHSSSRPSADFGPLVGAHPRRRRPGRPLGARRFRGNRRAWPSRAPPHSRTSSSCEQPMRSDSPGSA